MRGVLAAGEPIGLLSEREDGWDALLLGESVRREAQWSSSRSESGLLVPSPVVREVRPNVWRAVV